MVSVLQAQPERGYAKGQPEDPRRPDKGTLTCRRPRGSDPAGPFQGFVMYQCELCWQAKAYPVFPPGKGDL